MGWRGGEGGEIERGGETEVLTVSLTIQLTDWLTDWPSNMTNKKVQSFS